MTPLTSPDDTTAPIDTAELRRAFGRFPSGVTAVCALDADGEPIGMAASSFVGVSLEPALVGFFVQRSSTTWPALRARPRIGVSVLGATQGDACRQLASRSGDRFAGLEWHNADGALLLHGATAWFECEVEADIPTGDHDFVLLRVRRQQIHLEHSPLVFFGSAFHGLDLPRSA